MDYFCSGTNTTACILHAWTITVVVVVVVVVVGRNKIVLNESFDYWVSQCLQCHNMAIT